MESFIVLISLLLMINGCLGSYYFDLMDIFGVSPYKNRTGTTKIDGPNGGKAVMLSDKVNPEEFSKYVPTYSYIINAASTSTDFTFHSWVYLPTKFDTIGQKWPLFVLQDKDLDKRIFAIGFEVIADLTSVVEGEGNNAKPRPVLYIEQYETITRITHQTQLHMKPEIFKIKTWFRLMVRIRKSKTTSKRRRRRATERLTARITVDCNKFIKDINLKLPSWEKYPLVGYANFGMELKYALGSKTKKFVFPGAMAQAELINGTYAFQFFSRCDANFSTQTIPGEPRPGEYSEEKMKLFQKLSSQNVEKLYIECQFTDKNNKTVIKYSGETWSVGLWSYRCEGNKIKKDFIGETCKVNGTKYRKGDTWIDPNNKCVKIKCSPNSFAGNPKYNLNCTEIRSKCTGTFLSAKQTGTCCGQCAQDTCKGGRMYYEGCVRRCGESSDFVCKKVEAKCYCPKGMVEDDNGKCIEKRFCQCRSGSNVYQPGQTAVRSYCTTCVCSEGNMECINQC